MPAAKHPLAVLLDPALYFGAFLFFVLTSTHHQWPFTALYNIEYVLLPAGALALIPRLRASAFPRGRAPEMQQHRDGKSALPWGLVVGIWLVGFLITVSPVLSHVASRFDLEVLKDSNWRSLGKVYVAAGGLLLAFVGRRRALIDTTIVSLVVFAAIFLIRRFIYMEVDEETLRPILKTTHGDPNFIASLLVAGMPIVAYQWLGFYTAGRRGRAAWYLPVFALFLGVIILTESRMALISLAIIGAYLLASVRWPVSRTKIVFVLVGCLVAAGIFGGSQILDRFGDMTDDSNQDRVKSIQNGLVMFQEKPLLGHGMHSAWRNFYKNSGYGPLEDESRSIDIHNAPVQVLAELGLVGLGVHLVLVLFLWTLLMRTRKNDVLLATFTAASFAVLAINMLSLPMAHQYLFHQWLLVTAVIMTCGDRGTITAQ